MASAGGDTLCTLPMAVSFRRPVGWDGRLNDLNSDLFVGDRYHSQ
jgi:hypothetical protein